MADVKFGPMPPEDALKFFRAKGYKITWNWEEAWQEAHARAFTVAKAMNVDILQDIRNEVEKALADGIPFEQFKQNLMPRLKARGWWGKKYAAGPDGATKAYFEGTPWRLKTIYRTNLDTAYAAGRWKTQVGAKDVLPYLMYDAVNDKRTRPAHAAMDGKVYPVDSPFWDTNYPPNGFGCRCSAISLSPEQVKAMGLSVTPPGTSHPPVADPGWGYNPGKSAWEGITPEQATGPDRWVPVGPNVPEKKVPLSEVPEKFIDTFKKDNLLPSLKELLAKGMTKAEAERYLIEQFLAEFGASIDTPKIIRDAIGDHVVVSDALFINRPATRLTGKKVYKATKLGRDPYLKLLAGTIRDPYEIWMVEYKDTKTGKIIFRKRYLKMFRDTDGKLNGISVFEYGNRQWDGITVFKYDKEHRYEAQRNGVLLYRKK